MSGNTNAPWRDEELLRQKYCEEQNTTREIASQLGCSQTTIRNWLSKFGIETRGHYEKYEDAPWRDEKLLRKQYHEKGKSSVEIAKEWGCTKSNVLRWMKKHGIKRRKTNSDKPPWFGWNNHGYAKITHKHDGDRWGLLIHRLVAVANFGVENVKGEVVHHKNGVKWDNTHQNIEVMSHSEHAEHHIENREYDSNGLKNSGVAKVNTSVTELNGER